MAWQHDGTTVIPSPIRPGYYESKSAFSNPTTGEARAIILKWDHEPTAADKTAARAMILDRLTNPPPNDTTPREAKLAIKAILANGALTNAQKLTQINAYLDAMVGAD